MSEYHLNPEFLLSQVSLDREAFEAARFSPDPHSWGGRVIGLYQDFTDASMSEKMKQEGNRLWQEKEAKLKTLEGEKKRDYEDETSTIYAKALPRYKVMKGFTIDFTGQNDHLDFCPIRLGITRDNTHNFRTSNAYFVDLLSLKISISLKDLLEPPEICPEASVKSGIVDTTVTAFNFAICNFTKRFSYADVFGTSDTEHVNALTQEEIREYLIKKLLTQETSIRKDIDAGYNSAMEFYKHERPLI